MGMSVTYATIDGELVYENRGGVETYYVPDTQGSLIECHDATGAITYEAWYWPYGEIRTLTGSKANSWGYIGLLGNLADTSQSLYVRARYYLPSLTRWQTIDLLWPNQSSYRYVLNSPVRITDESGLDPWLGFGLGLIGCGTGLIGGWFSSPHYSACQAAVDCAAGSSPGLLRGSFDSTAAACIGSALVGLVSSLETRLCADVDNPCIPFSLPSLCDSIMAGLGAAAGCLISTLGFNEQGGKLQEPPTWRPAGPSRVWTPNYPGLGLGLPIETPGAYPPPSIPWGGHALEGAMSAIAGAIFGLLHLDCQY